MFCLAFINSEMFQFSAAASTDLFFCQVVITKGQNCWQGVILLQWPLTFWLFCCERFDCLSCVGFSGHTILTRAHRQPCVQALTHGWSTFSVDTHTQMSVVLSMQTGIFSIFYKTLSGSKAALNRCFCCLFPCRAWHTLIQSVHSTQVSLCVCACVHIYTHLWGPIFIFFLFFSYLVFYFFPSFSSIVSLPS